MQLPTLNGNWVDFLIVAFLLLSVFESWRRGLMRGLLDLAGFVLSFVVALRYYPIASGLLIANFTFPKGIADAAGFLLVAFVAEVVLAFVFSYGIDLLPANVLKSRVNRVFGFVPPALSALVTVTFVLSLALALPIRGSIKSAISDARIGGALVRHTHSIERQLGDVFGDAAQSTLNFLTVAPQPSRDDRVDLNFTQENLTIDAAAEQEMLTLVNQERTRAGLNPLEVDTALRELARAYARDMFERGYFSHYSPEGQSPFDRMDEAGITYRAAGENLALAPTTQIAHNGLMDSTGHRENILSAEFGTVGIGVIDGGVYGRMFVQEFTD